MIFSDETQVKIDSQQRVSVLRKSDEVWRLGQRGNTSVSAMFWGCLTYDGVGTLDAIQGNINSEKYIDCLDRNLWPVIAKIFPTGGYIFQEDNAPVHTSKKSSQWKNENSIPVSMSIFVIIEY